jgi:hypothetical protein
MKTKSKKKPTDVENQNKKNPVHVENQSIATTEEPEDTRSEEQELAELAKQDLRVINKYNTLKKFSQLNHKERIAFIKRVFKL